MARSICNKCERHPCQCRCPVCTLQFRGGGSLDGLVLEVPRGVTSIVTIQRDGNQSHYAVDDTTGAALFSGFNTIGKAWSGIMREFSEAAKAERAAVEAAQRPVGCGKCGRTFANQASHTIHAEHGRCLPDGCFGQLVNVDGVWDEAWRHPALRR